MEQLELHVTFQLEDFAFKKKLFNTLKKFNRLNLVARRVMSTFTFHTLTTFYSWYFYKSRNLNALDFLVMYFYTVRLVL